MAINEKDYILGEKAAYLNIFNECLRRLDLADEDMEQKYYRWVSERQSVISILRDLCDEFGDNNWDDGLNLRDIIEKHLAKHLWESQKEND